MRKNIIKVIGIIALIVISYLIGYSKSYSNGYEDGYNVCKDINNID